MSCSLYRWTEKCEGYMCPGDCDLCDRNMDLEENINPAVDYCNWENEVQNG